MPGTVTGDEALYAKQRAKGFSFLIPLKPHIN